MYSLYFGEISYLAMCLDTAHFNTKYFLWSKHKTSNPNQLFENLYTFLEIIIKELEPDLTTVD